MPVLNINELANSLKPVVLPGELMRVFVIKEGKEQGQGVAYLDDGTMVVVDQARKALGKTIEVSGHQRAADDGRQDDLLPLADAPAGEDTGRLRRERSARDYHRGVEGRDRWTPDKPMSMPGATTSEPTPEPVSVASLQQGASDRSKLA